MAIITDVYIESAMRYITACANNVNMGIKFNIRDIDICDYVTK